MRKNKIPSVTEGVRAEASDANTLPERLTQLYYRYPTVLASEICQNPRTAPELLEKLSETKALQASIARNPNTPLVVLYRLWANHPNALLQNPALPLWQLENPDFLRALPGGVIKALLSLRSLDGTFLALFWDRANSLSYDAGILLVSHPNLPRHLIEEAAKKENHGAVVAKRPDLRDESIFLSLLGSTQVHTRQTVEEHPHLPKELLSLCKRVGWFSVHSERGKVAPTVKAEELMQLVKSGPFLAGLIVQHPNVSSEVLHALADHFSLNGSQQRDEIWRSLAGHQKGDEALCLRLIREAPRVCSTRIAMESQLTHHICKELLRAKSDPQSFSLTLTVLCQNASTPDVVLARLVRQHAAHCAHLIAGRATLSRMVILALREFPTTGARYVLEKRADLTDEDRRALSADLTKKKRPRTQKCEPINAQQASLLEALTVEQLRDLATLPPAPKDLPKRASQRLLELLTPPTSAPPKTQQECLRILQSKELLSHQLEQVMYQNDPLVRRALARHKDAPLPFLLSVVFGGVLGELLALSKNPSLPAPIRRWSEEDPRLKRSGEATSRRHRRGSLS